MPLKATLSKLLKWFVDHIAASVLAIFVTASIAAWGGIFHFSKSILDRTILLLNIPTPLWATILLILLCGLYIYLIKTKRPSRSSSFDSKVRYYDVGSLKWKTEVWRGGYHKVESTPLCKQHDLPLIYRNEFYLCPEGLHNNCRLRIYHSDLGQEKKKAESYIDKMVRDEKY